VKPEKLIKVTCILSNLLSDTFRKEMENLGIPLLFVQPSRSVLLKEKRIILDYRTSTLLQEFRRDIFRFYLPKKFELPILSHLIHLLELNQPGRGSIYSEDVTLFGLPEGIFSSLKIPAEPKRKAPLLSDLVGINCIVQRGEGNILGRSVLERGISVPTLFYGRGMGLRGKLGILRVTISLEKEILFLTAQKQDSADVINFIVHNARLNHPGKGFIYMFPLRKGTMDTRIYLGRTRHLASMEQIITAIDELKQASDWRRKTIPFASPRNRRKRYLKSLLNYTLLGNEGETEPYVKMAMDAGAGGATLSRLQCLGKFSAESTSRSAAKEMSTLVLNRETSNIFQEKLETSDFFEEGIAGILEVSEVELASTYLPS